VRAGGSAADDSLVDIPAWWADRWRARYPQPAAEAWFATTLRPAPLALRAHTRRVPRESLPALLVEQGVVTEPSPLVDGALRVVSGNPVGTELLRQSLFALRGEASQLVAALLPAAAHDRVLDACAGRGGKTLQIAEDARPRLIVAADVSPWRVAACGREAAAAGMENVRLVVADLSGAAPFRPCFQKVLVDAPCSGLGTVRRRPELKWRNDAERMRRLARLQRSILGNAADALAIGGTLIYATCSTEPEENEDVVTAVLETRPELERRPVELPAGADRRLVDDHGYFRTYPHFVDLDGFFAALLVKTQ
jgi:16S rRNA (cytosine967-C5)-methyltransferase